MSVTLLLSFKRAVLALNSFLLSLTYISGTDFHNWNSLGTEFEPSPLNAKSQYFDHYATFHANLKT